MKRAIHILLGFLLVLAGAQAFAQTTLSGLKLTLEAGQAVEITANKLEMSTGEGALRFSGDVHISQPGFELSADAVTLATDNGRIESLTATGNVQITRAEWTASAGRLTYSRKAGTIVLAEVPVVQVNGNRIAGREITFFIADGRVVVDAAQTRVQLNAVPQQGE